MREWLESLSAEAQEALGGELLEVLQRRGTSFGAPTAVQSRSIPAEFGFAAAALPEIGLHNLEWRESGGLGTPVGGGIFSEISGPAAQSGTLHQTGRDAPEGEVLEALSRRLEREDRRYDNGFSANA